MPAPKSAKEVKQFLGLIGYYRKFIPRFSDLSRPLTRLTRHDAKFEWSEKCEKSFNSLRDMLMEYPILRYPDPSKPYVMYTDASGIGWSGVLTQEDTDEKGRVKSHPICSVSGQFRGSQLNWAALTKEAYAIYMSIRRLTFYLTDAEITIKCDHLPLKKFLNKQTLNSKVNNWAVGLEQFNLKLEWIQGSKNTLADSLSRLLEVLPEAKLEPGPDGQEFGCYCFEELEPICTEYLEEIGEVTIREGEHSVEIKLPLKEETLKEMQKANSYCRGIASKLHSKQHMNKMFVMEKGILYRLWMEHSKTFKCILVPNSLKDPLLTLAHQHSGHNGAPRTYSALKREYYWLGMRKDVFKHCKACYDCRLQNQGQPDDEFKHFTVPELPIEMICMDLVGPISPVSSAGNRYILTVIDMLTGYTMAVPIPDKKSETVCSAYRDNVYCIFGGSSRVLTDNGTEFRSKEMKLICEELDIKHGFSPVYTLQANGRLEGWHCFLKACIAKHIRGTDLEWDKLVPLAVSAYNFFPCQSSRESPFVLMFGRDPITPIAKLLEPRPRYYGDKGHMLRMDTLRKLYMVTAENIRRAREKTPKKEGGNKLQVGDLVFVRDPDSGVFEPRYSPNYRVIAIHGANRIEVQDKKGHRSVRRTGHVKRVEPVDKVCQQLPPEEVYRQFGRASKLLLHPNDVPDVKFLEVEKRINRERGNDKITICELTAHPQEDIEDEEMHNKGSEKSINPS